jgi:hypothetical protein|eukprot:COSAG02_NODE_10002_length_2053_cov_4.697544_3_plen_114_part_00
MPVIAVALPSLQFGFNQVAFARRLARYFIVPLGLVSAVVSHSAHKSIAATSSSLLGVCCTVGATVNRLAARRNWLNAAGTVLMLGAAYRGHQLEQKQNTKAIEKAAGGCCAKG